MFVPNTAADEFVKDVAVRDRLEREIGDVGIALILLCDRAGIDLLGAIERKIELNAANYPANLVKGKSDRPAVPRP